MEDSEMTLRRVVILPILLTVCIPLSCSTAHADQPPPKIEVYFSPHCRCTDAIVRQLDAAKKTVLVQAYTFTSRGHAST
jgi:hypothetical protein